MGANSTAQHIAAQHSTAHPLRRSTAQRSTAQHSTSQHITAHHSAAQHTTQRRSLRAPPPQSPPLLTHHELHHTGQASIDRLPQHLHHGVIGCRGTSIRCTDRRVLQEPAVQVSSGHTASTGWWAGPWLEVGRARYGFSISVLPPDAPQPHCAAAADPHCYCGSLRHPPPHYSKQARKPSSHQQRVPAVAA
jgi:hypothetical protein